MSSAVDSGKQSKQGSPSVRAAAATGEVSLEKL